MAIHEPTRVCPSSRALAVKVRPAGGATAGSTPDRAPTGTTDASDQARTATIANAARTARGIPVDGRWRTKTPELAPVGEGRNDGRPTPRESCVLDGRP